MSIIRSSSLNDSSADLKKQQSSLYNTKHNADYEFKIEQMD